MTFSEYAHYKAIRVVMDIASQRKKPMRYMRQRQIPKSELERKIKSDFETALNELKENMKEWTFVHNDSDDLTLQQQLAHWGKYQQIILK